MLRYPQGVNARRLGSLWIKGGIARRTGISRGLVNGSVNGQNQATSYSLNPRAFDY